MNALVQSLGPDGHPFGAPVAVIATRLTVDWLRPTLESQGMDADEAAQYEVGFDCSLLVATLPTWELAGTAKRTKALMRVLLGREWTARDRRIVKHMALAARNGPKPRRYRHGRVGVR